MNPKASMIVVEFDDTPRFLLLHTADNGLAVDPDAWIPNVSDTGEVYRISQSPLGPRWLACSVKDGEIHLSCGAEGVDERWQRAIWGTLLFHMSVTLYDAGLRDIALTGAVFLVREFAKDVPSLFQRATSFGTSPAWIGAISVLRDLPVVTWEIPQAPQIRAIGVYAPDAPAVIHGVTDAGIVITVQISGDRLDADTGVAVGDCPPEVAEAALESVDAPEQFDTLTAKYPEICVLYGAIAAHDVVRQLCSRAVVPIPGMILTAYGATRVVDE